MNWFISSASVIGIFLSNLSASFNNSFAHSSSSVCTVSLIALSLNFFAVALISIDISCHVSLLISFPIVSISSLIALRYVATSTGFFHDARINPFVVAISSAICV